MGVQLLLLTSIAGVDLWLSGLPIYLNQQMTDYSIQKSIDVWQMNAQRNLPGVKSITVYRHTGRSMMLGAVTLENWAAIDTWENWWNTPEGDEWCEKFFTTGKLVERIIFEVVE